jgi:hypothetical protein
MATLETEADVKKLWGKNADKKAFWIIVVVVGGRTWFVAKDQKIISGFSGSHRDTRTQARMGEEQRESAAAADEIYTMETRGIGNLAVSKTVPSKVVRLLFFWLVCSFYRSESFARSSGCFSSSRASSAPLARWKKSIGRQSKAGAAAAAVVLLLLHAADADRR